MIRRITHAGQQGARLRWSNDLFQLVEQVPHEAPPPALPLPEVFESDLAEFHRAQLQQALRQAIA